VSGPHRDLEPRLAEVLAQLAAHEPADPTEARSLARTRALARWLPAPFDQEADATHLTGSAVVVDEDDRVVLHRHKRLGLWLQPGGHVDPGERAAAAAARETLEETGLSTRHHGGAPCLVHVDVHPGPRGHLHLDLRYLLVADGGAPLAPGAGESPDVGWFTADEACAIGDGSVAAAVRAAERHLVRTRTPGGQNRRR
jgi:8-oxo-dGTP pyrophosphatase MutT (NUDIX family)